MLAPGFWYCSGYLSFQYLAGQDLWPQPESPQNLEREKSEVKSKYRALSKYSEHFIIKEVIYKIKLGHTGLIVGYFLIVVYSDVLWHWNDPVVVWHSIKNGWVESGLQLKATQLRLVDLSFPGLLQSRWQQKTSIYSSCIMPNFSGS